MDEIMPNRALTDRYDYIIPYEKKRIQYISTSQGCTHKLQLLYNLAGSGRTVFPQKCGSDSQRNQAYGTLSDYPVL